MHRFKLKQGQHAQAVRRIKQSMRKQGRLLKKMRRNKETSALTARSKQNNIRIIKK